MSSNTSKLSITHNFTIHHPIHIKQKPHILPTLPNFKEPNYSLLSTDIQAQLHQPLEQKPSINLKIVQLRRYDGVLSDHQTISPPFTFPGFLFLKVSGGEDDKRPARSSRDKFYSDLSKPSPPPRVQHSALEVMMRLFSPRKTTLMFVIRDKSRTPLENLEPILREDIQKIWDSVPKPDAHKETPMSEFFNVEVVALSSFEEKEEQFREHKKLKQGFLKMTGMMVANLRQRFFQSIAPGGLAGDRRGAVPASGFSLQHITSSSARQQHQHNSTTSSSSAQQQHQHSSTSSTADPTQAEIIKDLQL
ncbi:hypothetical protein ACFE04_009028 [Oxalis oulophora]